MDLLGFMEMQLGVVGAIPIQTEVITMFIVYLHDSGCCVQTIKQKLSAVTYLHGLHQARDPCKDPRIARILKALVKDEVPSDPKNPITSGLLDCIIEVVADVVNDAYEAHLFRVIFSLLYHACLRISECVLTSQHSDDAMKHE